MFDWSGKNADKSGKGQGILISFVSGNMFKHAAYITFFLSTQNVFLFVLTF